MHLHKLPDGTVNALIKPRTKRIDLYFDVPCSCGKIMSTDLSDGESQNGERRRGNSSFKRKVFINDAEVVLADVKRIMELFMPLIRLIMPA
jgi:hypothetical protein